MATTSPPLPTRPDCAAPWSHPAATVLADLASSLRGLDDAEAARRLTAGGPNALRLRRGPGLLSLVLSQLRDTMILVLLCAAVLTVVIGDLRDTTVILVVIAVNTALGVVQQRRAERAVAALATLSAPAAHVVRDGVVRSVSSGDVVVGDVVRLEAGDLVPADARLVQGAGLQVDESALTGESVPVLKDVDPVAGPDAPVAERTSMVHAGTVVTAGRGTAVVTATAMSTQVGRIAELLDAHAEPLTPLQRRLATFGRQVAAAAVVLCVLVLVLGLVRGQSLEAMLLTAVSLAVAAVPESLPAVVALSLALSAQRMATQHAIVRTLPAVEALGSVTVIASDKTGTLTEGVMAVRALWTPRASVTVGGQGYDPTGPAVERTSDGDGLDQLLRAVVLCNDARLVAPTQPDHPWTVVGDPTEGALLAAAGRAGVERHEIRRQWPRTDEEPFDAQRARMTTVHRTPDGGVLVVCKGAPEVVLDPGPLLADGQDTTRSAAAAAAHRFAEQGLRVLAVAVGAPDQQPASARTAERDLVLVGLVAMQDPPRPSAAASVAECRRAGIVPIMITGDHPSTAAAIASSIGILGEGHRVVTGRDLPNALVDGVESVRVYARTAPEQKLDIVQAWRSAGHVVAMTGDGVNDAPALRHADVGVAMGRSGTEVARQAADVVLADDQFATIVSAVGEGRRVYDNIRRFLLYGLAGGTAEVLLMLVGPFFGLLVPLLPAQILWVNLLTHGLPGVALGAERAEPQSMGRPPRDPAEGVLDGGLWQRVLALAVLVAGVTLALGVLAQDAGRPWQTMVFVALAAQQLLIVLTLRSQTAPAWHVAGNVLLYAAVALNLGLLLLAVYWPPLADLLSTETLSGQELAAVLGVSLVAPVVCELAKALDRRTVPST